MPGATVGICDYLEWDSNFFGLRIAKYRDRMLDREGLNSAERWCLQENIDCLYLLAESSDPETAYLAQANAFRFVDARMRLEAKVGGHSGIANDIREARTSDLDALRRIARVSHYDSRFFFDPRFSRSRCEDFYAAWIERSVEGWASAVLVAEAGGQVAGYVTCHCSDSDPGSIGLLAVDLPNRGQGFGDQLVAGALRVFEQSGKRSVAVVTQARNIASQRLYQRFGFRTRSVQLWFHRWFSGGL